MSSSSNSKNNVQYQFQSEAWKIVRATQAHLAKIDQKLRDEGKTLSDSEVKLLSSLLEVAFESFATAKIAFATTTAPPVVTTSAPPAAPSVMTTKRAALAAALAASAIAPVPLSMSTSSATIAAPVVSDQDVQDAKTAWGAADLAHQVLVQAAAAATEAATKANEAAAAAQIAFTDADGVRCTADGAFTAAKATADAAKATADAAKTTADANTTDEAAQDAAASAGIALITAENTQRRAKIALDRVKDAHAAAIAKCDLAKTADTAAQAEKAAADRAVNASEPKVEAEKKKYEELVLKLDQQKVGMFDPTIHVKATMDGVKTYLTDFKEQDNTDPVLQRAKAVKKYVGDQLIDCFLISEVRQLAGLK